MTLKEHYGKMFLDISLVFGILMLALVLFMKLAGQENLAQTTLWGVLLLSATVVFRIESFVNLHNLPDHRMRQSYFSTSVLADVTLLALFFFTPGGKVLAGKFWLLLSVYIPAKGLFYLMIYLKTFMSAKEVNSLLKKRNA